MQPKYNPEMQPKYNPDEQLLDSQLRKLLQHDLPQVNENHWFTPRVMNRLPERSRWASVSIWQLVFYGLGAIALIFGIYFSGHLIIESGFNIFSLTILLTISLLLTVCGAILTVPTLIRILREP